MEYAQYELQYVIFGPTLEFNDQKPLELLCKMASLNSKFELCVQARARLGVPEPRNSDPLTEKHINDLFSMRSSFDPKIRDRIVQVDLCGNQDDAAWPAQRTTQRPQRDCDPEQERQKDRRRQQGLPYRPM